MGSWLSLIPRWKIRVLADIEKQKKKNEKMSLIDEKQIFTI